VHTSSRRLKQRVRVRPAQNQEDVNWQRRQEQRNTQETAWKHQQARRRPEPPENAGAAGC